MRSQNNCECIFVHLFLLISRATSMAAASRRLRLPFQADSTFHAVYIPTFKVSSIGGSGARTPLFPNRVRTCARGGDPLIHVLPPLIGTLTSPEVSRLALCPPLSVRSASVAKSSCHCGTSTLSVSEISLAQQCPLISLTWLLLYPAGFLDISGCIFPQRNMQ